MKRWNSNTRCPICDGHPGLPQGTGTRCIGFLSTDEAYAYCSREEHAGALDPHPTAEGATFAHRLAGSCRCGLTHGETAPVASRPSPRPEKAESPRPWAIPDDHVEMRHRYFDERGDLAWELCRLWSWARPLHRGAKALPRHRGPDGEWYFGQGARWRGNRAKPLYREAEGIAELAAGGHVFLVEGERDADALWDAGLVAMASPGAGSVTPEQAARIAAAVTVGDDHADPDVAAMSHASVDVVGDDDPAGIKGARETLSTILEACPRLRGRMRAVLPPEGVNDVAEWLESARNAA